MLEVVRDLHLGEWATFVIVVSLLWKFVCKSLVETWFKNKLEIQKQQVGHALQLQKELVLKQAEFEKIKLERVLPLLESVNGALSDHKMMFNSYISYIINKGALPKDFESKRLALDTKIIAHLSSLAIYLPEEFRTLIYQLRKVISCSWYDPQVMYRILHSFGAAQKVPYAAQELYIDLFECFYAMCNHYLGVSEKKSTYAEISKDHNLNFDAVTTKIDPVSQLAYKFILLHEYFGSREVSEAQTKVENLFNAR
jgi:hypothetical protein